MAEFNQPAEIAREALRRLATRKLPPTPDNYRNLYREISGAGPGEEAFPDRALKLLGSALPKTTPEQLRFARHWEAAVTERSWTGIRNALQALLERDGGQRDWGTLIRDLAGALERRQSAYPPAKKRESLELALASVSEPDQLFARLQTLLRSWSQAGESGSEARAAEGRSTAAESARMMRELFAQLLKDGFAPMLGGAPEMAEEALQIAEALGRGDDAEGARALQARVKKFVFRMQWVAEDESEMKSSLLHLLQLIIDNIREMVVDDPWLDGQVGMLRELFASRPASVRQLNDAERRLRDVLSKQSNLKKNLNDARDQLKSLLASFVDHLAGFTVSTGGYHDKIERCAARISAATDIHQLSDVVQEVMQETRLIQLNALRSRDELMDMRMRVEQAEREIARLQQALTETSELIRQDPLTGALNRKGLEEALSREASRAQRRRAPLCVSLLDVDDFKGLNDAHGHLAGDGALVHLARVVKETLRPQDTVARYGGEEFVLILPETELDDAVTTLARLQRELTRRFFVHNNDRLLVTFSAGVARLRPGEDSVKALERADAAMYDAKRAGKNRVVAAPDSE